MAWWSLPKPPSSAGRRARAWAGYAAYAALAGVLLFTGGLPLEPGVFAALRHGLGVVYGAGLLWLLLASELGRCLRGLPLAPASTVRADQLLLLWLGLLPLFWFPSYPGVITGSDLWFPLEPADFLTRVVFAWDERVFAGAGSFLRLPHVAPYYLTIGGLDWLGLPLPVIERVWFVLLFSAPGLALYACARAIARHQPVKIIPVFAALIFMLSPVVVKEWSVGHQLFALAAAGWAGLLALLVRLNAGALSPFGFALRVGLLSLLMTPVMSNPALALVYAASLAGLALALTLGRAGQAQILWAYALAFGLTLLLHLWWLLPTVASYQASPLLGKLAVGGQAAWVDVMPAGQHSTWLNLLRLVGYSGFSDGVRGEPYVLFAAAYQQGLDALALVGLALPALAGVALLAAGRARLVLALALQLVLGLVLAHGLHAPGHYLFQWLYEHVPAVSLYRDAFSKFIPLVAGSYALLAAVGLAALSHATGRTQSASPAWPRAFGRLAALLGLAWLALVAWPLFTGDVIRRGGQVLADHRVVIPSEYAQVRVLLHERGVRGRVLLTPDTDVYVQYHWGYQGPDITTLLLPYPQLFQNEGESPPATSRLVQLALDLLQSGGAEAELRQVLTLLNVEYVLHRRDIDNELYGLNPPHVFEAALDSSPLFTPLGDFASLRLYAVQADTDVALPVVNTAELSQPFAADSALGTLLTEASAGTDCPASLLADATGGAALANLSRVSPTQYFFDLTTSGPSWLVFNQSFDTSWEAYASPASPGGAQPASAWYRGSALLTWLFERAQRVPLTEHCLVNGYANGWRVPQPGHYRVTLEFVPQRYLEFGALLSASVLFVAGGWTVFARARRPGRRVPPVP